MMRRRRKWSCSPLSPLPSRDRTFLFRAAAKDDDRCVTSHLGQSVGQPVCQSVRGCGSQSASRCVSQWEAVTVNQSVSERLWQSVSQWKAATVIQSVGGCDSHSVSGRLWQSVRLTPNRRIPLHGFLLPVNKWGNLIGRITASFRASLAADNPATSSHFTFGFSITIAPTEKRTVMGWVSRAEWGRGLGK